MEVRKIHHRDSTELYALIEASRADLKNLVWSRAATLESTIAFINAKLSKLSTSQVYVILDEGKIAGCLEIWHLGDHDQLGYWLGTAFRGKRLMQQALRFILHARRVRGEERPLTVRIRTGNLKSQGIVRGAGFEETGRDGEWISLEWRSSTPSPAFSLT